jgi:hypothetical protein
LLGFVTGILWVRIFHTVPVPANTIPVTGTGTYHTCICTVSHETCGITHTHGILIIKIIITYYIAVLKNKKGGRETRCYCCCRPCSSAFVCTSSHLLALVCLVLFIRSRSSVLICHLPTLVHVHPPSLLSVCPPSFAFACLHLPILVCVSLFAFACPHSHLQLKLLPLLSCCRSCHHVRLALVSLPPCLLSASHT